MNAIQALIKYFAAVPLGFTIFGQLFVVVRAIRQKDKESLRQAAIVILAAACIIAGTIIRQEPGPLALANIISIVGGLLFTYPAVVAYKKLGQQKPKHHWGETE